MLSSLRRAVCQTSNFNGLDSSATNHFYCFLYTQNSSLSVLNFSSSPNYSNSSSSSSLLVNYLINSWGLSEHQAIAASEKIDFKTSTKPDSVINLLENYGFTKQHISKTICQCPYVLSNDPQKTLKPKLDYFNSKGLSGLDLAKFVSTNTGILRRKLGTSIMVSFENLKNMVHSDKNVVTIIKRHSWLLTGTLYLKNLVVNIEHLRDKGVPQSNVTTFLVDQPSMLTTSTGKFEAIVEEIKGMGFDPSQGKFLIAIKALNGMSKLTWETKLSAYRKWGWSDEEIQNAFKKHPRCMTHSEKKIMSIMDCLVNQMGYNPSPIAEYPVVLSLSLRNRIMPRCVVIQFLVSKGKIDKQISLRSLFGISEKSFLEKYVKKYEAEAPELLKVYQTSLSSSTC
ncbi:uncharacterized protein LOC113323493 [Papaver somniferum]|uniref:uncharacterized protein LOC113323493 n=1 Tax=Papaver somniferum TaxID=3469 RepID=UPI000E703304|nr:uncharacterized protein LOC113323493 [Papaver somniferum]